MQIKRIELFHIAIPCIQPFVTSFGTIETRPALIIRMISDAGLVGYGESSTLDVPISEPETTEDAAGRLIEILPRLIGISLSREFDFSNVYSDALHPVSLFGIDAAYSDLLARTEGLPLRAFFGATNNTIRIGESVGLKDSLDAVTAEIAHHQSRGITRIKVKIAPGRDLEIVEAVRSTFPHLSFGADANAAYTASDVEHLARLKEYDLAFVEQPFSADDLDSHARLRRAGIRICLDESVRDLSSCKKALQAEACDMVNIKPARIGSFKESKAVHDVCHVNGIALFGGGRLETGVGKSANAHFYALPGFTDASDITPPAEYLEQDIATPAFSGVNGIHTLTDAPGSGIELREDALEKYLVQRYIFGN